MSDPCFRRINRNIVECKDGYKFFNINAVNVLIETLWNVKEESVREHIAETMVLIETLWNVKHILFHTNKGDKVSINRNIVECKVHRNRNLLCTLFPY